MTINELKEHLAYGAMITIFFTFWIGVLILISHMSNDGEYRGDCVDILACPSPRVPEDHIADY